MKTIKGVDAADLGCLVETLYETTQDHGAWQRVMALLCQYLHADSASIRFYTPDWSEVAFSATHGFDPDFDASYRQHFVQVDPIPTAIDELRLAAGTTALLDEVIPFERLKRTEFYNDYLRPQDKRHIMGGYLYQDGSAKAIFGVQRVRRRRAFKPGDKSLLKPLAPHFQQVLRLHQVLTETQALSGAVKQALDALNVAVFFLDKRARVRFANAGAEALVRNAQLVLVRQGQLHARRRGQDRSLQTLIEAVTMGTSTAAHRAGGAVRLADAGIESGAVTAIVTPWRRALAFGTPIGTRIMAAVFIGACARPRLQAQYLVGAYGLTCTEARLAAKLIETCNLECAAEAIGVTKQTGRDYLKSVFRKTDCHSQAELIGMILSSPSGLWGRETKLLENRKHELPSPPQSISNLSIFG